MVLPRTIALTTLSGVGELNPIALKAKREGASVDDPAAIVATARASAIDLSGLPSSTHVFLDGGDVSEEIRTPDVSELASRVASP